MRSHGDPFLTFDVVEHPATFATAQEARWKEAIGTAVAATGVGPRPDAWFRVRIDFRTPRPATVNDRWDIDNLVKPTLDAMEGVFGVRPWKGVRQANDDRVVELVATQAGSRHRRAARGAHRGLARLIGCPC